MLSLPTSAIGGSLTNKPHKVVINLDLLFTFPVYDHALMHDDFACDVRDAYVKEIILEKTIEEAMALVKEKRTLLSPMLVTLIES